MKNEKFAKIASERIEILFQLAAKRFKDYPEYSNRYVELARKISMRNNVPIPSDLKRRFCKACGSYLSFGNNATVRTNPRQMAVIISCKKCGSVSRYPYRMEKAKMAKKADKISAYRQLPAYNIKFAWGKFSLNAGS